MIHVSDKLRESLEKWMRTHVAPNGFRASQLVDEITEDFDDNIRVRIAGRLIQKNSRFGNIKLHGANNWCWVR